MLASELNGGVLQSEGGVRLARLNGQQGPLGRNADLAIRRQAKGYRPLHRNQAPPRTPDHPRQ